MLSFHGNYFVVGPAGYFFLTVVKLMLSIRYDTSFLHELIHLKLTEINIFLLVLFYFGLFVLFCETESPVSWPGLEFSM